MEEQDNKKSLVDTFLRVIAKHSISLHMMSRDMNIARINIQKLVKLEGGKVRDKPDAMWKSEERLDAELEKEKEKLKPQKVEKTEVKEKSLFEKISDKISDKISSPIKKAKDVIFNIFRGLFNPKNILSVLSKIALPLLILTTIWQGIVGAWEAYQETGNIGDAFVGAIGQIVEFFSVGLIDKEMVKGFFNSIQDLIAPLVDSVGNFFGSIGKWFADKFAFVGSLFGTKLKSQTGDAGNKANEELKRKRAEEDKQQKEAAQQARDAIEAKKSAKQKSQEKRAEAQAAQAKKAEEKGAPAPVTGKGGKSAGAGATGTFEAPATAPRKMTTGGGSDKETKEMIKKHEGVRTKPYQDSLGLWTVGVGHLIGDGKTLPKEWDRELSMKEVDELFDKDYEEHKKMAEKTPGYEKANEKGKAALIDLAFNMGGSWYKKFPNAAKALKEGNYEKAADELQNSQWYKQVKGRGVTIVGMIRDGGKDIPSNVVTSETGTPIQIGSGGFLTTTEQTQKKEEKKEEKPKSSGDEGISYPSSGGAKLVSPYGQRKDAFHGGLDYSGVREGTPIQTLVNGKIAIAGELGAYGNVIDMLVNGEILRFAHLNKILVKAGEEVSKGKIIGLLGNTGRSEGPHLHFEHRSTSSGKMKGNTYDPLKTGAFNLFAIGDKPVFNDEKMVEIGKQRQKEGGDSGLDSSGSKIAANSVDISAAQRQQQKPQTPIIVNAPTTNNNVVTTKKQNSIVRNNNVAGSYAAAAA